MSAYRTEVAGLIVVLNPVLRYFFPFPSISILCFHLPFPSFPASSAPPITLNRQSACNLDLIQLLCFPPTKQYCNCQLPCSAARTRGPSNIIYIFKISRVLRVSCVCSLKCALGEMENRKREQRMIMTSSLLCIHLLQCSHHHQPHASKALYILSLLYELAALSLVPTSNKKSCSMFF